MLRKDLEDLEENGQVGDWCFMVVTKNEQAPYTIMFLRYPISDDEWLKWHEDTQLNNRGDFVSLPLSGAGHPVWQWDGNREAPTLSPSIGVLDGKGGFRWHGWLRGGKLVNT